MAQAGAYNESNIEEQTLISSSQTLPSSTSTPVQSIVKRKTTMSYVTSDNVEHVSPRSNFGLRRAATTMLTPEKKVGPAPGALQSLKSILCASWLNVLLVFIPISWVLRFVLKSSDKNKDTLVFVFSFLAIIPLAKLLGFATEELSLRVGQTLAGLLNATLGNAVELIVAIIALLKCELQIVQSSLVGSILSNLLLVLGMCFFAGGLKYSEQGFGASASQVNSSLLTVSVIAVLLPAAFSLAIPGNSLDEANRILHVSHGVAIILLFIYGSYLYFQLYSHAKLYDDHGDDVVKSVMYSPRPKGMGMNPFKNRHNDVSSEPKTRFTDPEVQPEQTEEEEEATPQMSVWMTIVLLVAVTTLVAVTAEWLVDSINGLASGGVISREFVGIILLPIVGNAAEHVTAVTVSVKDKLTLSLGVAVGSSIQIALFVIPFIVTLAWILGKPLTLLFDPYESVTLFLAVLTVNYVVQDGKSNWLEGMILMCLYFILGVTFWFYTPSTSTVLTCT